MSGSDETLQIHMGARRIVVDAWSEDDRLLGFKG